MEQRKEYPKNHLSSTSKMDGVKSWSLQALETYPGAYNKDGSLVPVCSACYATSGYYHMPTVIKARSDNKEAWKNPKWVEIMIISLENERYFRWFDSGDMYALALANKIYKIMQKTTWVRHWLPTKMYKFPKFHGILNKMKLLPNVSIRFSSDSIDGTYTYGLHGSVVIPSYDFKDENMFICQAYLNGGKCGACKACYDPSISIVGYKGHGKPMEKLQRLLNNP